MRRAIAILLMLACGLAMAAAAAAAGGGDAGAGASALEHPSDLDRDGVFDHLEQEMRRAASDERLPVIVTLRDRATAARVDRLQRQAGDFAVRYRFSIIDAFAGRLSKRQIRRLAADDRVVRVESDRPVHASNASAQAAFGVTKARIDAPGLDGNGDGAVGTYSKTDLVAAVIDTGIDAGHQDLNGGKVLAFADFVSAGCNPCLDPAFDDNGHGTHVAATIAGEGDARGDRLFKGVAPAAALVGVKVLDASGNGFASDVVAGIDWVVANKATYGIEAINLSLGAEGCGSGGEADSLAVNRAADAGIVPIVAAGNEGPGRCTVGSPGAAAKALTVGAMADMPATADSGPNGFFQARFSSRGPTADGRIKPDISAPGVNITSARAGTTGSYLTISGTSMATPFTAGVALLMLDANAALTPQQIKDRIAQTAVDWARGGLNTTAGTSGQDIDYGFGRLDAYAALEAAGAALSSPPDAPKHVLLEGTLGGNGAQADFPIQVTDTRFPIAATLIHPTVSGETSGNPNFNLTLLNPNGAQVAAATTSDRQEQLGYLPPVTGTYTLRVTGAHFDFFQPNVAPFFIDVSHGSTPPPPDTTPPAITDVSPADGAAGVPVGANVAVTFSEAMNQSATQGAFTLRRTSDNQSVPGSFSWSGETMTFDPSASLEQSTGYTATVTTAAKDLAGNALTEQRTWSFTTSSTTTVTAFPTGTTIEQGTLRGGSFNQLAADDNAYYEVNSAGNFPSVSAWRASFTGVATSLADLKVTYAGKNSRNCTQAVSIFRFTDSTWVQLDSRTVGTTEVLLSNLVPPGAAAGYVGGPSGDELRVRVRCQTSGFGSAFFASGDLLKITYDAAGSEPPPPDTTPPTISSVSPAGGATGVPVGANVGVTFSEAMDQSATQGAFTLRRTSDNQLVAGAFSWSGETMTFDPAASLDPGTGYTATVTTAAKDLAGNALAEQRTWSFTTSSAVGVTAFPTATTIEQGFAISGGAAQLAADDNAYFEVGSSGFSPAATAWYGRFTGVAASLADLKVSYAGKNSAACTQVVSIFRFTDSTWVQLDSRNVGTTEVLLSNLAPPGAAAGYVGGPSGDELRVRVRCQGSSFGGTFSASGDLLKITYTS